MLRLRCSECRGELERVPAGPRTSHLQVVRAETLGSFFSAGIISYGCLIGEWVAGTPGVLVMRNHARLFAFGGRVFLYAFDVMQLFLFGTAYLTTLTHSRVSGSTGVGVQATGPVYINVSLCDVSGCVGDAISLDDGAMLSGSGISGGNVAGHTNGGVGLRTSHGARAHVTDPATGTIITGVGGDVVAGSNAADTWTNIATNQAQHTTDFNAASSGVATSQGCRIGA